MNIVVKVSCNSFDDWKKEFDGHDARANVCDESRTTVGKVDDKNAIVMMYDVDMQGLQKLMMSDKKVVKFNSAMHALNFMDQNGWKYVEQVAVQQGDNTSYKYLMQKK